MTGVAVRDVTTRFDFMRGVVVRGCSGRYCCDRCCRERYESGFY